MKTPSPKDIPNNNPNETDNYRNKHVENHTAGAITVNNSTGREYIHLAHKSGSHLTMANQATSEFNPNNRQTLTNGDTYHTTKGSNYVMAQQSEHRIFGDLTFITGDNNLFTTPLVDNYMKEQNKLAAAKSSPEVLQPGFGNVTGASHKAVGGIPDPKTGSTQDVNFSPNPVHTNIQELYKDTQKKLTPYEKQMGNGGSIKFQSGKDILIQAGTAATNFDTVFINPIGRKVVSNLKSDGTKITKIETSAPYFEEKDVASGIPFGNIHILASNKLDFNSAAGGIAFGTSGPIRLAGKGITTIGGAQVNITGSAGGGATGHVFIAAGDLLELEGGNINIKSAVDVVIEPGLSVIGNQIVNGDLTVGGNLTVMGNIKCLGDILAVKNITTNKNLQVDIDTNIKGDLNVKGSVRVDRNVEVKGTIKAKGNISSDVDVKAGNISLKNHRHQEQGDGNLVSAPI